MFVPPITIPGGLAALVVVLLLHQHFAGARMINEKGTHRFGLEPHDEAIARWENEGGMPRSAANIDRSTLRKHVSSLGWRKAAHQLNGISRSFASFWKPSHMTK